MEKLYTIEETAQYLKVSVRTVFNYIEQGRLNTVSLGSRLLRIKESEILRFLGE